MIRPFNKVKQEINNYKREYFAANIRFNRLALEITKECTNKCVHCSNLSSPQDKRNMEFETIKRLVKGSKENGIKNVQVWGGEPFLHADLDNIVKYVFANNLHLMIMSNGFWGTTKEAALQRLAGIMKVKPEKLRLDLILSCDALHTNKHFPLAHNVANILMAANDLEIKKNLIFLILGINLKNDRSLEELFNSLPPQFKTAMQQVSDLYSGEYVEISSSPNILALNSPLIPNVGSAKSLDPAIRGSNPLNKVLLYNNTSPLCSGVLYVGTDGEVFMDSYHVGDKILPIGNIREMTVQDLIATANRDALISVLHTRSFRDILYPFRKYVNVDKLIQQSHSKYELFIRMWQKESEDHDKTEILIKARAALRTSHATGGELLKAFDVIRKYGDISDYDLLKRIFTDITRPLNERWEAAFIATLYGDTSDYFMTDRIIQNLRNIPTPGQRLIAKNGTKDMGEKTYPEWYVSCDY